MDISFLRTFLEVSRRRHFGKAADVLCLTQSAVSARIKLLESSLGVSLFTRDRNNIQLTPAGQRLQKHARTIVDGWEQARQSIALDEEFSRNLIVGALGDVWSMQSLEWSVNLRRNQPDIALQLESYSADTLLQRLESGLIDLALLFDPPQTPGFVIRETATHELLLVSSSEAQSCEEAMRHNHVMVDWGSSFALALANQLPNAPAPSLRTNQGRLALELITQQGGSAWLPMAMIQNELETGRLHRVEDAPQMERIVYAVYRPDALREETIRLALSQPWHTQT
jgi:LysR family transcriptional regulator, flagellar master operon regulator